MMELTIKSDFTEEDYAAQVMGCWLGKAIGGTLGLPFEGQDGPLDLEFYTPVPTEMVPNDDLDLQVVWACVLDRLAEVRVDRDILADAWRTHVQFPWDEYGVALRNMANGLRPPLSGSHDNWFAHGMGAAIRSELWACLAPGNPQLAAAYAYEDGCVDHAGEGIYGEMFLAALESLAFIERDYTCLLQEALRVLPPESSVRRAVSDTGRWWDEVRCWQEVRERILKYYGHENFTDVTMNVAFIVLGWLAGEGDFGRAICIATNCGKDTDCTAATVGALMGILDPAGIPEKWLSPIGQDLVLSPGIVGLEPPATLGDFTEMVLDLRRRLQAREPYSCRESRSECSLRIPATIAFTDKLPAVEGGIASILEAGRSMEFEGTVGEWRNQDFEDDFLLVRYEFELHTAGSVLILFNTPEICRVWCDDAFLFERAGGAMAPSFHRAPENQQAKVALSEGRHTLTATLARPKLERHAQWVAGIGDVFTHQWIADAFLPRPRSPFNDTAGLVGHPLNSLSIPVKIGA